METLLYFILWGGLLFLLMRFGCGAHMMGHGHGGMLASTTSPGRRTTRCAGRRRQRTSTRSAARQFEPTAPNWPCTTVRSTTSVRVNVVSFSRRRLSCIPDPRTRCIQPKRSMPMADSLRSPKYGWAGWLQKLRP